MIILISSAKTMTAFSPIVVPGTTEPLFEKEACGLMRQMLHYSHEELQDILKVSPQIAIETVSRYRNFFGTDSHELPAVLGYAGVVYKHIAPADFSSADFLYTQQHLRIASTGYGLLRPLDSIRPYRLEYDVQLPDFGSGNVAGFWRPKLTDTLIEDILGDDGILLNLASKEIQASFDWKKLDRKVKIVTPEFKILRNGKLKTIVIYAKMMRGKMARYVLKNQISDPEELTGFESEGFSFRTEYSDDKSWIFTI